MAVYFLSKNLFQIHSYIPRKKLIPQRLIHMWLLFVENQLIRYHY